jgi:multisubunit Na+/H+ antiporter MnhB subunit
MKRAIIQQGAVALVLAVLALIVARALLDLPAEPPGLRAPVADRMEVSGVRHPLTAVLLNFRGYDTLLEIGVLLIAVIGVWSLDPPRPARAVERSALNEGPVLRIGLGVLLPLCVLSAGYILWIGSYRPGGAFQAGSILAAGMVMMAGAGVWRLPLGRDAGWRVALSAGFLLFLLIATVLDWFTGDLLRYDPETAGSTILAIEILLSLSIGACLGMLVAGIAAMAEDLPGPMEGDRR